MQKAIMKEQTDIQSIAMSYMNATNTILKDYGCNATCVDQCTSSEAFFQGACDSCDCP